MLTFSEGEYYHVYNRGTEKRETFLLEEDYKRFQQLLFLCNSQKRLDIQRLRRDILDSKGETFAPREGFTFAELVECVSRGEPRVSVGAYCLMPNHFHLLLKEVRPGGISLFMQKLTTAYTMYFNKKYAREGALFQGTFKATHVDNDEYLKYLYSYIHLNPVKLIEPNWKEAGIADKVAAKRYLDQYRYSSYADHTGNDREERAILAPEEFPEYFAQPQEFDTFIDDWLGYKDLEEGEKVRGAVPVLLGQPA